MRKGQGKGKRVNEVVAEALREERNSADIIDYIDSEIGFLSEIIHLLRAASYSPEAWADISFTRISSDMLRRMERLKDLSSKLSERCGKENVTSRPGRPEEECR